MLDLRQLTKIITVGLLLVGGLLDVLLAWLGGNRSTISRFFLDFEGHLPYAAPLIAYAANLLVWHLTLPTFTSVNHLWLAIGKALLVLLPVAYLFYRIAVTEPYSDDGVIRRWASSEAGLALAVVVGSILGAVAGRYGVPQHVVY